MIKNTKMPKNEGFQVVRGARTAHDRGNALSASRVHTFVLAGAALRFSAARSARTAFDATSAGVVDCFLRREVNNSLTIVNFFHKIQNFRQISDLFSQI